MRTKSSGKKACCPVCGKFVTVQIDGRFWPHDRPRYRYVGTVPCEGMSMRNDDPDADDHGRLIWKAAKATDAIDVLPALIADARRKLEVLESDLARAPTVAAEASAKLNEWRTAHPKETP